MQKIELTQGYYALVDDEDYDYLNQFSWRVNGSRNKYAVSWMGKGNDKLFSMHKVIMGIGDEAQCDHINRNTLDNQKHNLRKATAQQNACNSPRPQGIGGSGYRGVNLASPGRWRAKIAYNYKQITVGTFGSAIEAAKAYDEKAKELHGEFAMLNFED